VALDLEFKVAVLKGRSHYLCPRRLETLRRHGPKTADELRLLAKVLVWLHETQGQTDATGLPLEEISMGRTSAPCGCASQPRTKAAPARCARAKCSGCAVPSRPQGAQAAHVVIVNHALLLADIAAESRVIPEYKYLGRGRGPPSGSRHTDGLSSRSTAPTWSAACATWAGPAPACWARSSPTPAPPCPRPLCAGGARVGRAYDAASAALGLVRRFFEGVAQCYGRAARRQSLGEYTQRCGIIPATRSQPYWEQVRWSGKTCAAAWRR